MSSIPTKRQHFAVFFSPGTFVSETSERPLETDSPAEAFRVALTIKERHGAVPFGFRIEERLVTVATDDIPSRSLKSLKKSGTYYIDGRVLTLADVEREMPSERILISNMRDNGVPRIVTGPVSGKGWRWTHVFADDDKLLDADGREVSP